MSSSEEERDEREYSPGRRRAEDPSDSSDEEDAGSSREGFNRSRWMQNSRLINHDTESKPTNNEAGDDDDSLDAFMNEINKKADDDKKSSIRKAEEAVKSGKYDNIQQGEVLEQEDVQGDYLNYVEKNRARLEGAYENEVLDEEGYAIEVNDANSAPDELAELGYMQADIPKTAAEAKPAASNPPPTNPPKPKVEPKRPPKRSNYSSWGFVKASEPPPKHAR